VSRPARIVLNDAIVRLDGISPRMTVLDWLRGPMALRGTKEGCAEGDCGACTVLCERLDDRGGVMSVPFNACLAMIGQLAGQGIRTIEGLPAANGALHPVQRAMVESDATQCGFCTPGLVMSIAAYAAGGEGADGALVHDALAGNLCRCTGYRPIFEAAMASAGLPPEERAIGTGATAGLLSEIAGSDIADASFLVPASLAELLALRKAHPEAVLLAGGTDLGLLASRDRQPPAKLIHLARVAELNRLHENGGYIEIGAAVPYERALALVARHWPSFGQLLRRLGSRQIRNLGSFGGNLGTASPIGDTLPVLLAIEAEIVLAGIEGSRSLPVDRLITGYRQTALKPDEVIVAVRLPRPQPDEILMCAKVSKRRDQDISAVCAGFRLRLADNVVGNARLAFGGMAAIPARAAAAERLLIGLRFGLDPIEPAIAALGSDFTPLDDVRGTAAYRIAVAQGLLRRLWLQGGGSRMPLEVDEL